jgi:hypothetical protein
MNHWTRRQFLKLSTAAVFQMMFTSCASLAESSTKNQTQLDRIKRLQTSPQYKDGEFVNPIDAPIMAEGSTWKYIKKSYFTERIDPVPTGEVPVKTVLRNDWTEMDNEGELQCYTEKFQKTEINYPCWVMDACGCR